MLGIFISSFDKVTKKVFKDFILFLEVSPTTSETAMAAFLERSRYGHKQIRLFVFMLPNSMFGNTKVVQRRIKNYASHSIYKNYRHHRLNLLMSAK